MNECDKQWGLKVRMQVSAARLTWSFLVLWEEAMWARYWMTFFVFSVLPAPDSPLQTQTGENKIVSGLIQHWEDIFCNVITVDVFIIYNLRAQDGLVFTICTKKIWIEYVPTEQQFCIYKMNISYRYSARRFLSIQQEVHWPQRGNEYPASCDSEDVLGSK